MLSEERLQLKRSEAIQDQYKLLGEKLLELRRSAAIESDVAVRFKLDKQIQQVEAELSELSQLLDSLESASENGRLYRALLKLGFQAQVRIFRKFVQDQLIGAFLIHGSLDYGQRWLLNRLVVQHIPSSITGKVVQIHLSRTARRNEITVLWRELAGWVGLSRQSSISEIADRVYQCWQSQSVLLVFHDVDYLPEAFLNELIRDFWLPLAAKSKEAASSTKQYRLLMFLVDYDGRAGQWNISFVERLNSDWKPDSPIKLPLLESFSNRELANWLEYEADELPARLTDEVNETVQNILKNSDNGVPEPVMEEICRLSGCNWYEVREEWLKL